MEERLDKLVLQQGSVASRGDAEALIQTRGVLVNGKLVNKPGKKFPKDVQIELLAGEDGQEDHLQKYKYMLHQWNTDFKGKTVLDLGSGKGSFATLAIAEGAALVITLNEEQAASPTESVPQAQVKVLAETPLRLLGTQVEKASCDSCLIDVDSTPLEQVFPFMHALLKPNAEVLVLVKPQDQVEKKTLSKGLLKSNQLRAEVLEEVKKTALRNELTFQRQQESPQLGNHGNREFFFLLKKNEAK